MGNRKEMWRQKVSLTCHQLPEAKEPQKSQNLDKNSADNHKCGYEFHSHWIPKRGEARTLMKFN